jgi:hypothetical protein
MSLKTVHDAIIDTLRNNPTLDAEFNISLLGTASSVGTAVTGIGTLFLTEITVSEAVKDYIGNTTSGFRKVLNVIDDTHLVVESAFTVALSGSAIKKSEIRKGAARTLNLTTIGKGMRISSGLSGDAPIESSNAPVGNRTRAVYMFFLNIGFMDPDVENAEDRKSGYDKMIRDAIDTDLTFGGVCIGITEMQEMVFVELSEVEGIHIGMMAMICYKQELTGDR